MKLLLFMLALLPLLLQSAKASECSTAVYCAYPHIRVNDIYCENHNGYILHQRCQFFCHKSCLVPTNCKTHFFNKFSYPLCKEICCITPATTPKTTTTQLPTTTTETTTTELPTTTTETTTTVEIKPTTTTVDSTEKPDAETTPTSTDKNG